jgi:hypothetical protein
MSDDRDDREEFDRRRRQRALVTALLLLGMCGLFYFITIARLQSS